MIVWNREKEIKVTTTSLAFFRQFVHDIAPGTYSAATPTYYILVNAIRRFADGFVLTNEKHTPTDGSLAEQYTRYDGSPISAKDLTWSYASALTTFAAREGYTPASWGAAGLVIPPVCVPNPGPRPKVQFSLPSEHKYGGKDEFLRWRDPTQLALYLPFGTARVFIVGSLPELGNWSPDRAIPLDLYARGTFWVGEYSN